MEEIDSIVWGGTMKTNRIEPLINNIDLYNCNLDLNSIISNLKQVLDDSSPLLFHNQKIDFKNSIVKVNNTNLHNNCIQTKHLTKYIIDKEYLKNNCISNQHIIDKSISTNHLQENIILSKHLTSKCIVNKHLTNNCIKIRHLDPNISYIFEKFHLQNGITTLDLQTINCNNIGFKDDAGKVIWKIELDKETNNLVFYQFIDNQYKLVKIFNS